MNGPVRPQRIAESTAEALRDGDPRAVEELYLRLRGDVYNLAARIIGDRSEAEDITQEVFLRAFRHLPGKADQSSPEAWVFRTTVNACYDHLRRRRPSSVGLGTDAEPAGPNGFERAATAAAVEAALGGLNPRYRTALVLKELHGLGNGEIAEVMGVARGTVGVLLFRARRAFERRYREVAPAFGAGAPVAGLAVWLPPLPLPASLAGPPAFLGPLAAATVPVAPAALAPVAATVSPTAAVAPPLTAVLTKLSAALTTKVVLAALAVTAVTGGGLAIDHARQATPPDRQAAAVRVSSVDAQACQDPGGSTAKTRGALAMSAPRTTAEGDAGAPASGGTASRLGDATAGGDGAVRAGDGAGTQTRAGDDRTSGGGTQSGGAGSGGDGGGTQTPGTTRSGPAGGSGRGPADGTAGAGDDAGGAGTGTGGLGPASLERE